MKKKIEMQKRLEQKLNQIIFANLMYNVYMKHGKLIFTNKKKRGKPTK